MGFRDFIPLSKRSNPAASAEFIQTLFEGVPDHLQTTFAHFLFNSLADLSTYGSEIDVAGLQQVERQLRRRIDWSSGASEALDRLLNEAINDHEFCLDLIDHQLQRGGSYERAEQAEALKEALLEGGSAWTVVACDGTNNWAGSRLERRVDQAYADQARRVAESAGRAGFHLQDAWASVYGRTPNPSHAYSQAIKAVEVAAGPIVTPNDSLATLGRMIGELKSQPGRFTAVLRGAGDRQARGDTSAVEITRLSMQLLWTSQHDRHGNFDPDQAISVSQQEAESAIALAVVLVAQFNGGWIRRLS